MKDVQDGKLQSHYCTNLVLCELHMQSQHACNYTKAGRLSSLYALQQKSNIYDIQNFLDRPEIMGVHTETCGKECATLHYKKINLGTLGKAQSTATTELFFANYVVILLTGISGVIGELIVVLVVFFFI